MYLNPYFCDMKNNVSSSEKTTFPISDTRDFLLTDYLAASDLLKNYSNMRITSVGASLALLGAVLTVPFHKTQPELALMAIGVISIFYLSIRIIGTLNSNVYARCIHLEWVEERLNCVGFFSYWNAYVPNNKSDAASNSYVLSAKLLNYGSSMYGLISAYKIYLAEPVIKNFSICSYSIQVSFIISGIVLLSTLYVFIKNHIYTNKDMDTALIISGIKKRFETQRNLAIMKNCKNIIPKEN